MINGEREVRERMKERERGSERGAESRRLYVWHVFFTAVSDGDETARAPLSG